MKKRLLAVFIPIVVLSVIGYFAFYNWLTLKPPVPADLSVLQKQVEKRSDSLSVIGASWLHQNDKGLWEMYTEGKAFERGVIAGKLTKGLIQYQEKAFIDRIGELIPSASYQRFLRLLIAVFNRGIDKYIPQEYLQEIYGISFSASDDFDYVGPKYDRILHYHGAHDIGHMLQNYNLVGCTSFAVWGDKSADSGLLIGRNFDFYVGDEFAENKIIQFCRPDSGYGFMMITWGGMCGTVSGMNEKGLTVTLNAGKSAIPFSVAEPVSLIAREILQFASDINEAYAIAKQKSCFVSESFLIGSATDRRAAVIEKSPYMTSLYSPAGNQLICTNHFQSDEFRKDSMNSLHIRRSASLYRYQRVQQLLDRYDSLSVVDAALVLRDMKGMNDRDIGMGNEKAVNQLIAHHSVIFEPEKCLVWISAGPYQIGEYICYDLKQVLNDPKMIYAQSQIYKKDLTLPPDPFLGGQEWRKFLEYRALSRKISAAAKTGDNKITDADIEILISSNPAYYHTYELCGDYYMPTGCSVNADKFYRKALEMEIPTMDEKERIENKLKENTKR